MTRRASHLASALGALAIAALAVAPPAAAAEPQKPVLGDAESYALIADQAITASESTVAGSVAIAGTDDLTGLDDSNVEGEIHLADQTALDVAGTTAAVNQDLKGQPCNSDRTGEDLADLRLGENVYCYIEDATLTGTVRLDALGDVDAKFVFQMAGGWDVANGSQVLLVNGAQACNVFWQVSGPVTFGVGSSVAGTIVTDDDVTMLAGSSLDGRIFAPQGSIGLTDASITGSACQISTDQVTTSTTAPAAPVDTDGDGIADGDEPGDANGNGVPDAQEAAPGTGPGSTTTPTTPDPDGTGGSGLPRTGPTLVIAGVATAMLAAGHALVGGGRLVEWNDRRWRPRHAKRRFGRNEPLGRHSKSR
ncbi:MAG TPA: ice-binding family protein [Acidimicrobiales bacterium]|nr:ice-binding family protein [Acidimicrobiales bacterium]